MPKTTCRHGVFPALCRNLRVLEAEIKIMRDNLEQANGRIVEMAEDIAKARRATMLEVETWIRTRFRYADGAITNDVLTADLLADELHEKAVADG